MARTRTGRAIGEIARRAGRGDLTAEQAAALTARLREQQRQAMYRAALDVVAARPVQVRLIGARADVAAVLTALDTVTTLTGVSDPAPARRAPGNVRVYATTLRRRPMTGGTR
ncbi:hypothetical protein ACFQY4_46120 [Catellatospora bangladeshensis]|uniref:Uncharacterized protein n=1 Tax=Catellatospora bangladeshensis TaxID=310355 RepID=A0A8J3K0R9_9ACTN|nr:hypothetical protein [Catellatospora bangladeshensis]GIF86499.1 hypothetical protein Cba03nite_78480 [Catellatospora bangladeshensis]